MDDSQGKRGRKRETIVQQKGKKVRLCKGKKEQRRHLGLKFAFVE